MSNTSQSNQILTHLKKGNSITFAEAWRKFGVMHLPRRILDLKEAGHNLHWVWEESDGKRYKRWSLL